MTDNKLEEVVNMMLDDFIEVIISSNIPKAEKIEVVHTLLNKYEVTSVISIYNLVDKKQKEYDKKQKEIENKIWGKLNLV